MKTFFCFCICALLHSYVHAQSTDLSYQERSYYLDVYDNSGKKIDANGHSNLSGVPFLSDDWAMGSVVLNNNQQYANIPLKFNVQNNTLYFGKDSTTYAFVDKVATFRMVYNNDVNKQEVLFRSGYPDHLGRPTSFLYQVINDGPNVQFLKYLKSNIEQHYVYGSAARETYVINEESYLYYVKENLLIKINMSLKSVIKALPDYMEQIKKFAADNNYKLDSDKEINQLITTLNLIK